MSPSEEWRFIPGYGERYEVSNLGRLRRWIVEGGKKVTTPKYSTAKPDEKGYVRIRLWQEGGERQSHRVHRLVLLVFVGPSELEVNHKNGDKSDNRLENLEYASHSQNISHAYHHLGRQMIVGSGEENRFAKFTDAQIAEMRQRANDGTRPCDLRRQFGISRTHLRRILKGEQR